MSNKLVFDRGFLDLVDRRSALTLRSARTGGAKKREVNLDDMYHEGESHPILASWKVEREDKKLMIRTGEGNFDDNSAKPSGAATPIGAAAPAEGGPPAKRKKGISKKAKTLKQRLAVADGSADPDTFQ